MKPFKKSGSKNYYFQVMIKGKRFVESTGESNLKAAIKKASERRRELKFPLNYHDYLERLIETIKLYEPEKQEEILKECADKIVDTMRHKIILKDVAEIYLKKPKKRAIAPKTAQEYLSLWSKFVDWLKKNFPQVDYLNEISLEMAEKYMALEWSKGISETTYNAKLTKFRAIFAALSENAGLNKNIWRRIDKMQGGKISKRPLSKQQLEALFNIASGEMRLLFLIGLYTGLRLGDAATLKWEEVNLETGFIQRAPNKTKNLKKVLEIPILGELKEELEAKRILKKDEKYVVPEIAEFYLKSPVKVSKMVQKTFIKARIKTKIVRDGAAQKTCVYGFHSFRHTFISLCAAKRVPINVVMDLVGHNSTKVHHIYQHADKMQKIEAIGIIQNEYVNGVINKKREESEVPVK